METNNTPTQVSLNERILAVLCSNSDYVTDEHSAIDDFKFFDVANAIERLILCEVKDTLVDIAQWIDENYTADYNKKVNELFDQIKDMK